MKIRLDFVTNSSSSSFVAYAIYSEELWDFLRELIDNGELTNKSKGFDEYYGLTACSYMSHIDQGVSITVQLGELSSNERKNFYIFNNWEEIDERSVRQKITDDENAKSLGYLHSAVSHFFDSLSSPSSFYNHYGEKDHRLDEILNKALAENKVRARTFMDFTDGFWGEGVFRGYEPPVEYWMDGEILAKYIEQPGITTARIPSEVKEIGSSAFRDCNNITSIIVPESVKSIKSAAFQGCKSLKEIQLPNTITQLENNTFRDCKSLESVVLPSSVKAIGDRAFMGCSSLASFSAGGLAFIGKDAFKNCKNLTAVPEIEQQAVDNQGEGLLKDKIVVHTGFSKADEDRITRITTAAGGTVKSSVVLKTDILVYNPDYDHETTKLKRAKELNENGKKIKIITLDTFLSSIEKGDFELLDKQSSHESSEKVKASGLVVLEGYDSDSMPAVDFPKYDPPVYYVEEIDISGDEAKDWEYKDDWGFREGEVWIIDYLGDKEHIIVPSSINGKKVIGISRFGFKKSKAVSMEIPGGLIIEDTIGFQNEALKSVTIGEGCTTIGCGAFGMKSLEEVKVSQSVCEIDTSEGVSSPFLYTPWAERTLKEQQFLIIGRVLIGVGNISEERVVVPDGIRTIGLSAINKNVDEVILPPSVTTICGRAFSGIGRREPNVKKLVFPKSMTKLKEYAFDSTEWIQNFGDSTVIINGQLYQMRSKEKVSKKFTIPDGTTGICENVMGNNIDFRQNYKKQNKIRNDVEQLVFPETMKTVGKKVFSYFESLKELVFPECLEVIMDGAFEYCKSLQKVVLPESLKSIGKNAFCFTPITELKLHNKLEKIGNAAFFCCSQLVSVELPCDLDYLGSSAFESCPSIKRIVLPSKVNHIGGKLITCRGNSIEYVGIKVPTIEKDGKIYYREPEEKTLSRYKEELSANETVYLGPTFPENLTQLSFDDFEHLMQTEECTVSFITVQINKSADLVAREEMIMRELKYNLTNLSSEEKLQYVIEILKARVDDGREKIVANSNPEALKKLKELYPELPVQYLGRWTKEVLDKDAYIYLIEQGIAKG